MECKIRVGEACPECFKLGLESKLRYFYINLEEEILKCESADCLYPHGDGTTSDEEELSTLADVEMQLPPNIESCQILDSGVALIDQLLQDAVTVASIDELAECAINFDFSNLQMQSIEQTAQPASDLSAQGVEFINNPDCNRELELKANISQGLIIDSVIIKKSDIIASEHHLKEDLQEDGLPSEMYIENSEHKRNSIVEAPEDALPKASIESRKLKKSVVKNSSELELNSKEQLLEDAVPQISITKNRKKKLATTKKTKKVKPISDTNNKLKEIVPHPAEVKIETTKLKPEQQTSSNSEEEDKATVSKVTEDSVAKSESCNATIADYFARIKQRNANATSAGSSFLQHNVTHYRPRGQQYGRIRAVNAVLKLLEDKKKLQL